MAPAPIETKGPTETAAASFASSATQLAGVDAGRRGRGVGEQLDRPGEGEVRLGRAQHRTRGRRGVVGEDHRRRSRRSQRGRVPGVGEEREVAGFGRLDARDTANLHVAVAFQPTVQAIRQVTKPQDEQAYHASGAVPPTRGASVRSRPSPATGARSLSPRLGSPPPPGAPEARRRSGDRSRTAPPARAFLDRTPARFHDQPVPTDTALRRDPIQAGQERLRQMNARVGHGASYPNMLFQVGRAGSLANPDGRPPG